MTRAIPLRDWVPPSPLGAPPPICPLIPPQPPPQEAHAPLAQALGAQKVAGRRPLSTTRQSGTQLCLVVARAPRPRETAIRPRTAAPRFREKGPSAPTATDSLTRAAARPSCPYRLGKSHFLAESQEGVELEASPSSPKSSGKNCALIIKSSTRKERAFAPQRVAVVVVQLIVAPPIVPG